MCGIAGIVDLKKGIRTGELESMTKVISHRGPDDEGYILLDRNLRTQGAIGNDTCAAIKGKNLFPMIEDLQDEYVIGFGHRRLSIFDLSEAGHQPLSDKTGKIWLTYNGEVYNFPEIRSELKERGYDFHTGADTEVVVASYLEWGEQCVTHFNGMWSFAIWDARNHKIFCSRDRLGAKPFHYFLTEDKFIFGSEIKEIVQCADVPRVINEEVLAANLIYNLTDYNDRTLINGIMALLPGYNLSARINVQEQKITDVNVYRYWDVVMTEEQDTEWEPAMIEKEIDRSIKYRLRSDAPLGALLSGGLDSSILVTKACGQLKERGENAADFQTFTACYENAGEHDETRYAQLVNRYNGCSENLVYPRPSGSVEKHFEELVWHLEGITYFSFFGVDEVLRAVEEKKIRVILNGQGSDETMFGYERYYAFYFKELLKKLKFGRFLKEYKLAVKNSRLTFRELCMHFAYFCFPMVRNGRKSSMAAKYYTPVVKKNLSAKQINRLLFPKTLDKMLYTELHNTQLTHILRFDDRLYMKHSIESRVPFIDYEYVEQACRIPSGKKIHNGYTKSILRQIMDGKMPDEITWRKDKVGFSSPVERWAEKIPEAYMDDLIQNARSGKYFNLKEIKTLFKKCPAHTVIQNFLSVEIFMRLFDVEAA